MTTHESKKDLIRRLGEHSITPAKLTAKSVSFSGFGFGESIFVTIHDTTIPPQVRQAIASGLPKPSQGGYCVQYANCPFA